jgi:beta-mannosidase
LNLVKEEVQKTIIKSKKGFSIILKSRVLQKDVFLFTKHKGHFSGNFFDMLPNKPKVIEFITELDSLGFLDDLEIKTLNSMNNTHY